MLAIQSRNLKKVVQSALGILNLVGKVGTSMNNQRIVNFRSNAECQGKGFQRSLRASRKALPLSLREAPSCYPVAMKGLGVAGEGIASDCGDTGADVWGREQHRESSRILCHLEFLSINFESMRMTRVEVLETQARPPGNAELLCSVL